MKNNNNLPLIFLLMVWFISPLLAVSAGKGGAPGNGSINFAPALFQEDMDFGDAPEGTSGYPTTFSNDGARHIIVPGIYLGNIVDPEPDGQPNGNADCDDSDCEFPSFGDDEDGVTIPSSVSRGSIVTIVVSASVNGYLDAWMDFNHVNGWADGGEHIFTNTTVAAGSNTISFTIPANAALGQTYVRFRFRDYSSLVSFNGLVQNGEVEDYLVNVVATPNGNNDFGDAPEGPAGYPTTLINDGARHTIVPGVYLGSSIDPEPDGQPGIGALCDDNDCLQPSSGDDEDGIIMPANISAGSTVAVGVIASVSGYLDAWIDYNHINGWADAGEHIFTNTPLVAGSNTISFIVPDNAAPGQTYARFRFRNDANPVSFAGLVSNGEVEDYTVTIEELPVNELDFGDAPEGTTGYPTTLNNNGARHIIVPGIFLGTSVDPEPDGQPNSNADCDDSDCEFPSYGDDEDGVTIPSSVSQGSTVTIVVTASVNGYLDAWMDFNHLNGWADADEHVFTNITLAAGSNTLSFPVPGNAFIGQSFIRFRFRDYDSSISFNGLVQNGEVEDYLVNIVATPNGNIDFGDAPEGPAGYPTTLLNDGARHTIVPGVYLGNSVDPEPDGQPGINADCDDNDCLQPSSGDDEDGVIMPSNISLGSTVSIGVVASANGYLDAWMDFDHLNGWADAGEHIFVNTPLTAGSNTVSFTVPDNAVIGQSSVRFRFRTYPDPISFTGLVSNGEVEDYKVDINISPVKSLLVTLFLEGFYDASVHAMKQAQESDGNVAWNKFDGTVVDTLSVLLAEESSPWDIVYQLHGVNINFDGSLSVNIPVAFNGSYYIVVKHRNSLETWSATPVSFAGNLIDYNFTTAASQSYEDNQVEVEPGVFAIYSGDISSVIIGTQDGYVDLSDVTETYNQNVLFAYGYRTEDLNGDGFVDLSDVTIVYNNNIKFVGMKTPPNP